MEAGLLSAVDAAEAIRSGEMTAEELLQNTLQRIEQLEPDIGAWQHLDTDVALEQARQADLARRSGRSTGPLNGVPIGIKDIIDTADYPCEYGTVLRQGRRPPDDAFLISKLREAGTIILGKTVTTELAVYAPGKTRNPYNTDHTPGGSSSGSAAAVACGMVPLAVGTQTNGSVIRPASYCGVFGFKPSFGGISRSGVLSQSKPLDTVGIFARDLQDLALLADVLMVYDAGDRSMRPAAKPQITQELGVQPPIEPRLAFVRTPMWDLAEETTKDAFRELIEHANGRIDIVDLPAEFDHAVDDLGCIMKVDLARSYDRYYRQGKDSLSDKLVEIIEGGQKILARDYMDALERIDMYNLLLNEIFFDYDAILTPSTTAEAPLADSTGDPVFCSIWSLCGVPALNLPIFIGEKNLPFGAQLVGQRGDDARLFRTAGWLLNMLDQPNSD
ncbi:MAG: amidase [Gammaproteobacteria bacterium]|nr:amidase [Gammaproteobacteria bacterium]